MKKLMAIAMFLTMVLALAAPASALEHHFCAPAPPAFGDPTSVEVIHTADGGAMANENLSKNSAVIPPAFGSPSSYVSASLPNSYLTPDLTEDGKAGAGSDVVIDGSSATVIVPGSSITVAANGFTEVTDYLYYNAGHLGSLNIPSIGLSVRIYEGTDSAALLKGAGHFEETSIWDGNVALAGHNRGVNNHFGRIHTLKYGDLITLTTKLGIRTYRVVSVERVSQYDRSGLSGSVDNMLTLYTCVQNQSAYRWCVRAVELV